MGGLIYCAEAQKFLDAFADTIHQLVNIHEQHFQAVICGEDDSARFDDLIHVANERKRDAKYAYLRHLEAHGCSDEAK